MRPITEVLRLKHEHQLSIREIGRSCGLPPSTVGDYLKRAEAAGLIWPLPEALTEPQLQDLLMKTGMAAPPAEPAQPLPDWPQLHQELARKGVTLQLLWREYRQTYPEGYGYSRFCQLYGGWADTLEPTMRHFHAPGEKMFVDWAGPTIPIRRFYSLQDLFKDGQRKVLYSILNSTIADMESSFRHIYNQFLPLLHAMKEMQIPPPKVLEDPVWYIINLDLKKVLSDSTPDTQRLAALVDEMTKGQFEPDTDTLNFTASLAITNLMQRLFENPDDLILMEKIATVFKILSPLSLKYNLWESQNDYFHIGQKKAATMQALSLSGDTPARQWTRLFEELGDYLGVKFL